MRGATVVLAIALGAASGLAACGGSSLKLAGEECTAASECAAGLQCDFGMTPAVCSEDNTIVPPADADPGAPDAGPPLPDAPPGTPDAAPPAPDAAVPDAELPPDAAVEPDAAPV